MTNVGNKQASPGGGKELCVCGIRCLCLFVPPRRCAFPLALGAAAAAQARQIWTVAGRGKGGVSERGRVRVRVHVRKMRGEVGTAGGESLRVLFWQRQCECACVRRARADVHVAAPRVAQQPPPSPNRE